MNIKRSRWLAFLAVLFVAFPLRLEVDSEGLLRVVMASAAAKDGDGDDGGGDDGDGDDGDDGDDDSDNDDGDHDDDDDHDRSQKAHRDPDKARSKQVRHAERLQNGARVTFSDGSMSEIIGDRFRRTDSSGRVLERRKAKGSDASRMRAYFESTQPASKSKSPKVESQAVRAYYRGRDIEIHYANGWTKAVTRGQYVLRDQFSRIVASRRATQSDITRLERFR
ncbi:hypothetical protein [Lentibacter algarum]|uniref:hypothetical protein n=1 Tax=Lentibacter algarum TaxID=576131 RepID=UPI002354B5E5|nr:hypothetical protein [Lentibacter algarum]